MENLRGNQQYLQGEQPVSGKCFLWTTVLAGFLAGVWVVAPTRAESAANPIAFGTLRALSPEVARERALAWLKSTGKADDAVLRQFAAIWDDGGQPVLERLGRTLVLGDADASRLLSEANDPQSPAPTSVPAVLKDASRPAFYRANLALLYGKALSNRRIYEEALEALRAARPDQVADPGTYFFHRAVAEHALLKKQEANRSLVSLTEDVADLPDRYKTLALLMQHDLKSWREKDLGDIARKMESIERRLELSRGGPHTQKLQKDVVARLDELIKRLENPSDANGGC
jgi:hypothetical protein